MYLHLMPFFRQAIPNHLRQFFGCYLGFLHGSVPVFPTNYWASESFYKRDCYYFLISLDTFQRRLLWPHRRFSFSRRILLESVARRPHDANK